MHAAYDEIRKLAFRALDGANAPAGIDEDGGHAVAWLEAAGLPGLTILADAIDTSDEAARNAGLRCDRPAPAAYTIHADGKSSVFFAPSVVDLLSAGAATSEDRCSSVELVSATHPLFLVPAAARFCPTGVAIEICWSAGGDEVRFTVTEQTVHACDLAGKENWTAAESVASVMLKCRPIGDMQNCGANDLTQRVRHSILNGLDVSSDAHRRVAAHAAKIWVPETQASREKGAGAGLTDND